MNRSIVARQISISLAIGLLAAALALLVFIKWDLVAADFTWSWRAARALLAHQNPYVVIQPTGDYPFDAPFYYPLPAAFAAIPFAPFPATIAGALFIGCSTTILAWALLRKSATWLLILGSAPYFMALRTGQCSPIVTAAILLPALAPFAVVKPNLGLGVLAVRPKWFTVLSCGIVLLTSLIVLPSWPWDWMHALENNRHTAPIMTFPGCLVLFTLLRWRNPNARLLLALTLIPQRLLFYDQLPLLLIAQTYRERLTLAICSWVGFLGWQAISGPYTFAAPPWVLWSCYIPALVLVLNPLPQQLRRILRRVT